MKLLILSAIIFLGTLIAAALVTLGEPGQGDADMAAGAGRAIGRDAQSTVRDRGPWFESASNKGGSRLR